AARAARARPPHGLPALADPLVPLRADRDLVAPRRVEQGLLQSLVVRRALTLEQIARQRQLADAVGVGTGEAGPLARPSQLHGALVVGGRRAAVVHLDQV